MRELPKKGRMKGNTPPAPVSPRTGSNCPPLRSLSDTCGGGWEWEERVRVKVPAALAQTPGGLEAFWSPFSPGPSFYRWENCPCGCLSPVHRDGSRGLGGSKLESQFPLVTDCRPPWTSLALLVEETWDPGIHLQQVAPERVDGTGDLEKGGSMQDGQWGRGFQLS